MWLFTLKKFLLLTSLIKTETAFQGGTWGISEQRAQAPKTISCVLGSWWGRICALATSRPGGPMATCKAVVFRREQCFSEKISAFCRAEAVVFFQVTPVILTASLAWGLHGQLGASSGGTLVSLSVTLKSFQHWAGMNLPDKPCAPEHVRHCDNLSVGWCTRAGWLRGQRNIWSCWTALGRSKVTECSRHLTLQQILCGLDKGCGEFRKWGLA